MDKALEIRELSVHYGGVQALTDVSLTVGPGQLVGLIGPNGAGKTTLIDATTGFTRASGTVRLGETDLSRQSPEARSRAGLARTWQAAELFDDLTVAENLAVATDRRPAWRLGLEALAGRNPRPSTVDRTLELLGIEELADAPASGLTHGQRKLVGVARALAGLPDVICLDEPAAGLDTEESQLLGRQLRQVVDGGVGMLLVDHDMGLILSICDHVVVLEFGKVIAAGTPDEVRNDRRVITAYLGASAEPDVIAEIEEAVPTSKEHR